MIDEKTKKEIEAIEKEKQEYLKKHPEEEEEYENVEVEETEFSLTEDEIEEWINELTRLKEEKGQIELSIDDETVLKINYEESDEDDEEDEEDED